jgi:hypothetical protein
VTDASLRRADVRDVLKVAHDILPQAKLSRGRRPRRLFLFGWQWSPSPVFTLYTQDTLGFLAAQGDLDESRKDVLTL